ncbi:MAG: DNA polymerase I [Phycisphaera sp.]|nr:DNA polymerase I [Phycisphaera sp.]
MGKSPANEGRTLYLIDGHAQIFRAYHAIRSLSSPVTKEPTNATFGFVGMLIKLYRDCHPDYVAVTIDVSGDKETFRSELYPQYKANRSAPPEDLHPQTKRIVEICETWGIPVIGIEGVEADDVIATLVTRLRDEPGLKIRIVSRDKDLEQLLGPNVEMYDIHKDETIDVAGLEEKKGIKPGQVIDVLALMGDNIDNVPGIPGVGPKTAAKLIHQYGSIDGLLENLDELKGKLKENLEANRDVLSLSRKLVTLQHDVPLDFTLESAEAHGPPVDRLGPMFKQLGFTRHLRDIEQMSGQTSGDSSGDGAARDSGGGTASASTPTMPQIPGGLFAHLDESIPETPKYAKADHDNYTMIATAKQLDDLVKTIRKHAESGGNIAVDTETDQLNPMLAKLAGISMAWKTGEGVYVPIRSSTPDAHLDEAAVLAKLGPVLEDESIKKTGHNLKYDTIVLRNAGITLRGVDFDSIVASYLIDATRSSHSLDNLALALLEHETISIKEIIGSGKHQRSMASVPAESVVAYASEDADIALRFRELFEPKLKLMGLRELFDTLEMPLVAVLAELEFNGIAVDPAVLDEQKKLMDVRIGELHDEILAAAGSEFNPDSPKQLAEVLFTKLKCKSYKRGKTGPSTDSEVLAKIADEQDPPGATVAALVLEYRMLTKLRGTYLESLKDAINPRTGRIHASFNQVVTATGRLSSSDPNLQNIPIRTEIGRQIRKAFVAPPGHVLLGADYSQIELRLLAHLSGDKALTKAFESDMDIHRAVAAQVFGAAPDDVTPEQRGVAKMVNFGIVYGVTPYGLARRLPADTAGSSVDEAKRIIADYKRRYPKIDEFLSKCVAEADDKGYVETICKRRRNVPEIRSNNANMAAFGRRIAINTVVQGSAADLIKLAMVQLHRRIHDEQRPMKMLLQIHDELVFEVPQEHVEAEAKIVRETMEGAMKLSVPLKVDVSWGTNWFEAK